jgi:hypothetical protein
MLTSTAKEFIKMNKDRKVNKFEHEPGDLNSTMIGFETEAVKVYDTLTDSSPRVKDKRGMQVYFTELNKLLDRTDVPDITKEKIRNYLNSRKNPTGSVFEVSL